MNAAVKELIEVARNSEPPRVQRLLHKYIADVVDLELEELAVWVLSGYEFEPETDRIRLFLSQGHHARAIAALVMHFRRGMADEIRRHKREAVDAGDEFSVEASMLGASDVLATVVSDEAAP